MTKTTCIIAMVGVVTLGSAPARAQGTAQPETKGFVNISAGGQFQSRTFSESKTFTLFGETGTVISNQTVGRGLVVDFGVGYRVWRALSFGVGVSTFNGKGTAAAAASIPNPLFGGLPLVKTFGESDYGNLSQTNIAVNIQLVYTTRVNDRWDLMLFAGPSVIRVKQEIGSATAALNTTATIDSESKTTAKAGNAGIDLTYRVNDRYGLGGFVRYAGGVVDLPSVPNLEVGGLQAGGGIRIRF